MSDELLRQAARALAEETVESGDVARTTRARVMAGLHRSEVRRRSRLTVILPLAACFMAASAWGTTGGRAAKLVDSVVETWRAVTVAEPPPEAPKPPAKRRPARPAAPLAVAPPALAPNPVPEPAPIEPAPATEPVVATPTPPARHVAPAPSHSAAAVDPAHALYRAAHRLHFTDRDYARALPAWDAYLHAAPGGRFALEARYNRALCLARLSRNDEARAALTPFARGDYGEYRRKSAAELIEALER